MGLFKRDEEHRWLPLQYAAMCGREDICMYLFGNMSFLRALADRSVDIDVRNDQGYTPLALAVRECCMPAVRFLLEQYQARGRKEEDVLRELIDRPPTIESGDPHLLIQGLIMQTPGPGVSEEDKCVMVKLLVEAGADLWSETKLEFVEELKVNDNHSDGGNRTFGSFILMPLHAAAYDGIQPVIDFFLTECGMPVDTCTSDMRFTSLHLLAMSLQDEMKLLPILRWLVEDMGADATFQSTGGNTAAELVSMMGHTRLQHYLEAQETRQAQAKEEGEKAVVAAAMTTPVEGSGEATAELDLDLEAEDATAAADNKKGGKASAGGSKKKKM